MQSKRLKINNLKLLKKNATYVDRFRFEFFRLPNKNFVLNRKYSMGIQTTIMPTCSWVPFIKKIIQHRYIYHRFQYSFHLILLFLHFSKAAKYLYKATECSGGDPSVAFNGLLKCVPNTELPEVCRRYLQRVP